MDYSYSIIIQENMDNGAIFMHSLPLDPLYINDALQVREAHYNSDCLFIVAFCQN